MVVDHLVVDPNAKLVKKKLYKMCPKVALIVKTEIENVLQDKIIYSIYYLYFLSNIFPL